MYYRVTYILGDKICEGEMSRRELEECRCCCEVVEALLIDDNRKSKGDE